MIFCARKLEPSQGSRDTCNGKAGIIEQLLELSRGRLAIAELEIGQTTDVGAQRKSNGERRLFCGNGNGRGEVGLWRAPRIGSFRSRTLRGRCPGARRVVQFLPRPLGNQPKVLRTV